MRIATVESTTLATVAYDETQKLLQLEFGSQAVYLYSDVPAAVHQALLCAPSKGRYFNQTIRGRFAYRRVRSLDATRLESETPARCHR
jgi:hypothetical protein